MNQLINFLNSPKSYPHPVDKIQIIYTHASIVALAGNKAYKIKKPVRFSFLDFSSLEKRKKVLENELLLNQNLTNDIYLKIIPITLENKKLKFNGKGENIFEYALQMNRLEDGFFLHQLLLKKIDHDQIIKALSAKLNSYYRKNKTTDKISKNGLPQQIMHNTGDNLSYMKKCIGKTTNEITFNSIYNFTENFYWQNNQLLKKRVSDGMIRDCHGDLRCEHIHIQNEKINIFDCIEFNERFRHIDIINDLAFLTMDMDFLGHADIAHKFRNLFTKKDENLNSLWNFYSVYRACVRGKVESFRSFDTEINEKERAKAVEKAGKYFALALKYATLGVKPYVLICCGNIASGKSTLAENLSEFLNIAVYSSDFIRKKSAGIIPENRSTKAQRQKIYNTENTLEIYNKLTNLAVNETSESKTVILDARFGKKNLRKILSDRLNANSVKYIFIETGVSEKTVKIRLLNRNKQKGVVSDARLEDFEKLSSDFESLNELEPNHYIKIDSEKKPNEVLEKTLQELREITKKQ